MEPRTSTHHEMNVNEIEVTTLDEYLKGPSSDTIAFRNRSIQPRAWGCITPTHTSLMHIILTQERSTPRVASFNHTPR